MTDDHRLTKAVGVAAEEAIASILWRRIDAPGHDACRLERTDTGWRLAGTAVFRHERVPACLAYELVCDREWRTQHGAVRGWLGERPVDFRVQRTPADVWALNGDVVPRLDSCVDLDFGFTPATNVSQLRRIALEEGGAAAVPVAWLDVAAGTLDVLHQRYERRTERTYWYEAPRFGYAACLEVNAVGFVVRYPGLWEAEP
jgi:hypothetical protein